MRTFSKIVLLCNSCFVIACILRLVEHYKRKAGNFDGAIPLQPLESMVVILGYGAIFLSAVFAFQMLYFFVIKKENTLPKWIVITNLGMFIVQIWYFFIS
ncbi:MAG: hypothetical protein WEA59_08425 [Ferruginibacter sp.]